MKIVLTIALIALVALASVNAESTHRNDGFRRVMASSKTIVSVEPELHRFCIPIGAKPAGVPKSVSLHVPRSTAGFSVKLDTSPLSTLSSPLAANDNHCKKVSSLFLVREFQNQAPFSIASSEINKAGAISGFIVGPKPAWISVRMAASSFESIEGADDVCESVLGEKSESAFEQHGDDGNHGSSSRPHGHNVLMIVRKVLLFTGIGVLSLCVVSVIMKLCKKCCCRKPASAEDNIELGAVQHAEVPANEAEEARDLALAIERSLSEEPKVVEVPQSASPQFVFLPPQFMPAPGAPVNGATPYVPMFAPQFMNYSLQERN